MDGKRQRGTHRGEHTEGNR
jgi:hypothetical protein